MNFLHLASHTHRDGLFALVSVTHGTVDYVGLTLMLIMGKVLEDGCLLLCHIQPL